MVGNRLFQNSLLCLVCDSYSVQRTVTCNCTMYNVTCTVFTLFIFCPLKGLECAQANNNGEWMTNPLTD